MLQTTQMTVAGAFFVCLLAAGTNGGAAEATSACPAPGGWVAITPTRLVPRPSDAVTADLAQRRVVLLGETHDNAEHHRWQLHTIAAIHARQPDLVLGFEMFPRRVQNVLDQWSAGELTEEQFLSRSEWASVWGYDPQLYLPIFHFARMHRIPMLALNVDRSLVRRVGSQGWASVPPSAREGVGDPAPPNAATLPFLYDAYREHLPLDERPKGEPTADDLSNSKFVRFVESMQLWDRAMAQAIAERLGTAQAPLVIGIMGSGHLRNGNGVPYQLRSLGVDDATVLLPWDVKDDCSHLASGLADLVFGLDHQAAAATERPRLGVMLEPRAEGVTISEVVEGSIAERAGAKAGDIIQFVAGLPVKDAGTVISAVQRQAPGTWLPITVRRGQQSLELVARFPASK